MEIKYSEKIDREIFKEINKMGKKISPVFGFKFPKVRFDKRIVPVAKTMSKIVPIFVDENKMRKIMKEIYGKDMPKVTAYINTTPFSTWDVKERWISISIDRGIFRLFREMCHEANHFMYDYCFKTKKYQDTEVKETLTVLNNVFNVEDKGWNKFSKQREAVFNFYRKTKDFKKTIDYAKNLAREARY